MFSARPKVLAAEGFFYGATTKHATQKSTAIETWLSQEIDGPGAEAIAQLLERRTLSTEPGRSVTVTLLMETVGLLSLSKIVPTPCPFSMIAFAGLES